MSLPRLALAVILACAMPLAAAAQESARQAPAPPVSVAAMGEVLQLDQLFDVLRAEGLAQAQDLAKTMLPSSAAAGWDRTVDTVYDLRLIRARFNQAFRLRLAADPGKTAEIMDFFASDLGQRLVTAEIKARKAFLDIAQEEAARVAADDPQTARDPNWRLIQRLIDVGDLVETNVAAALTGNLAFTLGLQDSGATGMWLPIEEISPEIWAQESQMRADSAAWLRAYFGLAYANLTEAELEAYVTLMESPAGQHFTAALFAGFDAAFRPVSRDLGRAVGRAMQERDA